MVDLTVVIPYYNTSFEHFEQCLKSVTNQLDSIDHAVEILIVDDGSSELSLEDFDFGFCDEVFFHEVEVDMHEKNYDEAVKECPSDFTVRVLRHKNNYGIGQARQTGIMCARGKYMCYLSSDDLQGKNFLKHTLNQLKKSKAPWVYSDYLIINDSGHKQKHNCPSYDSDKDFIIATVRQAQKDTMFVNYNTTMAKTRWWAQHDFTTDYKGEQLSKNDTLRYGEDLFHLIRAVAIDNQIPEKISLKEEDMIRYRIHEGSTTSEKKDSIRENNKRIRAMINKVCELDNRKKLF